jgi:hypothetical protein
MWYAAQPALSLLCDQDGMRCAACYLTFVSARCDEMSCLHLLQGGEMGCGGAAGDILIFVRAAQDLVNVLHTIFCYT